MRNPLGGTLRIGLSRRGMTLLHVQGWRRRTVTLLADHPFADGAANSAEQLSHQIATVLATVKCPALPATVIVANDWVRFWMVTPPANATRLSDCQAAATIRFQTLYGEPSAAWQIDADWHTTQPFLACAMPQMLLTALRHIATDHRLAFIEIAPQFIAAWNQRQGALPPTAWFGTVDHDVVTFAALHQGKLCAVRSVTLPAPGETDPVSLHDHVAREALRLHMPLPAELQLCGQKPAHWSVPATDTLTYNWFPADQVTAPGSTTPGIALAKTGLVST